MKYENKKHKKFENTNHEYPNYEYTNYDHMEFKNQPESRILNPDRILNVELLKSSIIGGYCNETCLITVKLSRWNTRHKIDRYINRYIRWIVRRLDLIDRRLVLLR